MGHMTSNTDHLTRSQLWSSSLKTVVEADLMGTGYVRMLNEFTDGDLINIPSIGQAEVQDLLEGQPIRYTSLDTGNYQFSIDQYKHSATYISEKLKQDSFYASELIGSFVPAQARAIAAAMETKIMSLGNSGQTASNVNAWNGADHRFVASGTNQVFRLEDIAKAKYALDKAYMPQQNRIAIVDQSVEYTLNTLSNIANVSNNPMWEGIITTGLASGNRFVKNIFGFDVYVSDFLADGISETVDSVSVTNGVANLFFSATPDVMPFVGHIRQAPRVDSSFNKDYQREEYVTTCRYGFGLFRPENMVVVLSDDSRV